MEPLSPGDEICLHLEVGGWQVVLRRKAGPGTEPASDAGLDLGEALAVLVGLTTDLAPPDQR